MFIYVILLVAIIALISKEFIVFNEESLILLTFVSFIYFFIRSTSSMVTEEFDKRADLIAKELELSYKLQEELLTTLYDNNKKQFVYQQILTGLGLHTFNAINNLLKIRQNETKSLVAAQLSHQLDRLVSIETQEVAHLKKQYLQNYINSYVRQNAKAQRAQFNNPKHIAKLTADVLASHITGSGRVLRRRKRVITPTTKATTTKSSKRNKV